MRISVGIVAACLSGSVDGVLIPAEEDRISV